MTLTRIGWLKGAMLGVLFLVLIGGVLVFAGLFDRTHRVGMMPQVMLWGKSTASPVAPMMGEVSLPWSANGMMNEGFSRPMMSGVGGAPVTLDTVSSPDRQTITTASLDLRVQNIDWTVGKVSEIVLGKGGYVGTLNRNQPKDGTHTAWMIVKIPTKDFFTTYQQIKDSVYYITNENLSGEDVTLQYGDLATRLKNKQAEASTWTDLLKKATNVQDVIAIRDHLTQVQNEIDSLQAQVRLMDNQTQMSALAISMVEDPRVTVDTQNLTSGAVFKQAVRDLLQAFVRMGTGLILVVITGIPIVLVYVLLLWIIYFFTKKGIKRFFDR